MIRPIMTKKFFLRQPSEEATAADAQVARDLADTLQAYHDACAGMAANMIGERKRIIAVFDHDDSMLVMFNPRLLHADGEFEAEEGCLALEGVRTTTRYRRIKVEYQDESLIRHTASFTGEVAQAIQHEIDHCDGIVI